MAPFEFTPDRTFGASLPAEERITAFLRSVYGWMCGGLAITALSASIIASSPAFVYAVATNRLLFWGLMIAQLGIVFVLSARVQQLAASTAGLLFVVPGVDRRHDLLYSLPIPASRWRQCSCDGGMSARCRAGLWHDHAAQPGGIRSFLVCAIGVVLASIVGMFWHSDALQFVILVHRRHRSPDWLPTAQRPKAMALSMTGQTGSYAIGALRRISTSPTCSSSDPVYRQPPRLISLR
jgi:hypothetical protein